MNKFVLCIIGLVIGGLYSIYDEPIPVDKIEQPAINWTTLTTVTAANVAAGYICSIDTRPTTSAITNTYMIDK